VHFTGANTATSATGTPATVVAMNIVLDSIIDTTFANRPTSQCRILFVIITFPVDYVIIIVVVVIDSHCNAVCSDIVIVISYRRIVAVDSVCIKSFTTITSTIINTNESVADAVIVVMCTGCSCTDRRVCTLAITFT